MARSPENAVQRRPTPVSTVDNQRRFTLSTASGNGVVAEPQYSSAVTRHQNARTAGRQLGHTDNCCCRSAVAVMIYPAVAARVM